MPKHGAGSGGPGRGPGHRSRVVGALCATAATAAVLAPWGAAWAQGAGPVPGGNLPGAALSSPGELVPQGSPIPRVLPPAPPAVAPGPGVVPQASPGQVPQVNVAVRSVFVEGATTYPDSRVAGITAGLTGPSVPLPRIEAARLALLNLYRADGYSLTSVTASVDPGGVLRFVVIEGRIGDVKLEGDIGPAGTQVLRFLNRLTQVRPIDAATLERYLLLAQDVPGVSIRAVLRPSASEPGALTLVAQVERQPFSALLSVDNRAFRLTGPFEALALVEANSFTEFGERTGVQLYHTNGNTQNFGQASTEAFIGSSGLRVRVYGGFGEARPAEFLRSISYQGHTAVFGGSVTYPLIRARQQTLNLSGYFDAIETTIRTNQGAAGTTRSRDALRVVRLGAEYALQDGLLGDERPAINAVLARVSQGISALGATGSGSDNPNPTRQGERTDFTKLTVDLSRTQTLFRPWSDASVALRGRVIGQVSSSTLPPAEKFFLGGSEFTRGFYAGEVTGDNAFVWSLELQLNTQYDFQAFGRPFNVATQFYAFYDRGETWERNNDPDARLSSVGIGVRANVTRFTEFDLEAVHRNTRRPSTSSAAVSALKADALFWRVVTRF